MVITSCSNYPSVPSTQQFHDLQHDSEGFSSADSTRTSSTARYHRKSSHPGVWDSKDVPSSDTSSTARHHRKSSHPGVWDSKDVPPSDTSSTARHNRKSSHPGVWDSKDVPPV